MCLNIVKSTLFECFVCKRYHNEPENGFMRDIRAVEIIKTIKKFIKKIHPIKCETKKECDLLEIVIEEAQSLTKNPFGSIERYFEDPRSKIDAMRQQLTQKTLKEHREFINNLNKIEQHYKQNVEVIQMLNNIKHIIDAEMTCNIQKIDGKHQDFINKVNQKDTKCKKNAKEKVIQLEEILLEAARILQQMRELLNTCDLKPIEYWNELFRNVKTEKHEIEHLIEKTQNDLLCNKQYKLNESVLNGDSFGDLIDEENTPKVEKWLRSPQNFNQKLKILSSMHDESTSLTPIFIKATPKSDECDSNKSICFETLQPAIITSMASASNKSK